MRRHGRASGSPQYASAISIEAGTSCSGNLDDLARTVQVSLKSSVCVPVFHVYAGVRRAWRVPLPDSPKRCVIARVRSPSCGREKNDSLSPPFFRTNWIVSRSEILHSRAARPSRRRSRCFTGRRAASLATPPGRRHRLRRRHGLRRLKGMMPLRIPTSLRRGWVGARRRRVERNEVKRSVWKRRAFPEFSTCSSLGNSFLSITWGNLS